MTDIEVHADEDRNSYWNRYYADAGLDRRPLPSQFAAFVSGELEGPHRIIEFGCGTGRDALFFSMYGHQVIGVDASEAAVDHCRKHAQALNLDADFVVSGVEEEGLSAKFEPVLARTLVFARFFLHAITEVEEESFLALASDMTTAGDGLAVEYRTVRDASNAKVTDAHYRRFVQPSEFQDAAARAGFDVEYAVEGFGFAKYKQDDAYVARSLLVRR